MQTLLMPCCNKLQGAAACARPDVLAFGLACDRRDVLETVLDGS